MFQKIIACLVVVLFSTHVFAEEKKVFTFGVVPQSPTLKVAKLWSPLLRHMTKESGVKLKFKTAKDIDEFEKRLAAGEYDFVYMDPHQYVTFYTADGYQAIAKRKDQPVKGIIVVPKDSAIESIDGLSNSEIAFSAPTAFGPNLVSQKFAKQNVDFTPKYVKSDDSVYLAVSKGLVPAGGGIEVTLSNMKKKVRKKLKVIWTADEYTPHAVAAHSSVPADVVQSVQKAFVTLNEDKRCSVQLKKLKIMNGLEFAKNSDWDDVRGLKFNAI